MKAEQSRTADAATPGRGGRLRRWVPIAVILCLMLLGYLLGWHEHLTVAKFIRKRAMFQEMVGAHTTLALAVYVLAYVTTTALSLPGGAILTIAGGFLFGVATASTATVFAATAGATLIFLAARTALAGTLERKAGPFMARFSEGFREDAMSYLLFLRLVPLFPFWLVNIAPALLGVRLRTFLVATFFGIIPGTLAFAFIGAGLDGVIAAQERANPGCVEAGTCRIEPSALLTTELVIGLAALGVVAILPAVWRRLKRKPA